MYLNSTTPATTYSQASPLATRQASTLTSPSLAPVTTPSQVAFGGLLDVLFGSPQHQQWKASGQGLQSMVDEVGEVDEMEEKSNRIWTEDMRKKHLEPILSEYPTNARGLGASQFSVSNNIREIRDKFLRGDYLGAMQTIQSLAQDWDYPIHLPGEAPRDLGEQWEIQKNRRERHRNRN